MQHIIIGTGPAGVIAAETLKKISPASQVTLIGSEPEPPYSRMAIPYFLVEQIDEEGTWLRGGRQHFSDLGVALIEDRVTHVDPASRTLTLDNGDQHSWDRLLIASGSHPVKPPIPGIDITPQVQSCWTLEDAREIAARAQRGANVVLMGAGFIGCIILEALHDRGVTLTVVETGDRMVPRMLNEKAGGLLKRWAESKGVTVYTGTSAEAIKTTNSEQVSVTLSNNETVDADLVIAATGVRPNIDFLDGTDIEINTGIVINDRMQSSVDNVFAAGDVAEGYDFSTGGRSVQAIQPTAADHGRIAALNMAGIDTPHQGSINMNVLDTLGLITTSFGLWAGEEGGDQVELYNPDEYKYINLQFDGDRLIGASTAGMTNHVGVIRGLIQNKTRLGPWKERLMKDPTRLMEAWVGICENISPG